MTDEPASALLEAREEMKSIPAADLIKSIEDDNFTAMPGPLKNRLEWQEIKRRLAQIVVANPGT